MLFTKDILFESVLLLPKEEHAPGKYETSGRSTHWFWKGVCISSGFRCHLNRIVVLKERLRSFKLGGLRQLVGVLAKLHPASDFFTLNSNCGLCVGDSYLAF